MEVKSGADEVGGPVYDHLGYDIVPGAEVDRAAARHPDRRGPQRAAAGPGPLRRHHRAGGERLLRLLGLRRRRRRGRPRLVRRPASCRCERPRSATPAPTSPGTPSSPPSRRSARPGTCGTPSTAPTWPRTSCPPGAGPPPSCARTPTTGSSGCGSARSEVSARRSRPDVSRPHPALAVRVRSPEARHRCAPGHSMRGGLAQRSRRRRPVRGARGRRLKSGTWIGGIGRAGARVGGR